MPILDNVISEGTVQIVRPVSDQISRSLLNYLGVYHIFKKSGFHLQDETLSSVNFSDPDHTPKVNENRCDVMIVPNSNPHDVKWDTFTTQFPLHTTDSDVNMFGNFSIFGDKRAGIYLHEVATPCSVDLTFRLQLRSRELSDMVYSALTSKFSTNEATHNYNDIVFSYPLADKILIALYSLYRMKFDDELSFKDYLAIGSNNRFDILANRHTPDKNQAIVIQKINNYVLGTMSFSGDTPEAIKQNRVAKNYVIEFTYTFQFSKPTLLRLDYPVMVENKIVHASLRPSVHRMDKSMPTQHNQVGMHKFISRSTHRDRLHDTYPSVVFPSFDDWVVPYGNYRILCDRYHSLFTGLLSVDVDPITGSSTIILDLINTIAPMLPENLRDHFITYVSDRPRELLSGYGIFMVNLFSGVNRISSNNVSLEDGVVTIVNCDTSKIYHVTVHLLTELEYGLEYTLEYMLTHYADFLPIIENNFNLLERSGYLSVEESQMPSRTDVRINIPRKSLAHGVRYGLGRPLRIHNYIIETKRR